jgi:hypothetical protein
MPWFVHAHLGAVCQQPAQAVSRRLPCPLSPNSSTTPHQLALASPGLAPHSSAAATPSCPPGHQPDGRDNRSLLGKEQFVTRSPAAAPELAPAEGVQNYATPRHRVALPVPTCCAASKVFKSVPLTLRIHPATQPQGDHLMWPRRPMHGKQGLATRRQGAAGTAAALNRAPHPPAGPPPGFDTSCRLDS